jgi:hypothetical protein
LAFLRSGAAASAPSPAPKAHDNAKTVDVSSLVALPSSGTLTAKVQGIAAHLDVTDFG